MSTIQEKLANRVFLNMEEAAFYCNLTINGFRKCYMEKGGKFINLGVRGKVAVPKVELDRWLANGKKNSSS